MCVCVGEGCMRAKVMWVVVQEDCVLHDGGRRG